MIETKVNPTGTAAIVTIKATKEPVEIPQEAAERAAEALSNMYTYYVGPEPENASEGPSAPFTSIMLVREADGTLTYTTPYITDVHALGRPMRAFLPFDAAPTFIETLKGASAPGAERN